MTDREKAFFLEHGYLCVPEVLAGADLERMREEFDRVYAQEKGPVPQSRLLSHGAFLDFAEHPPIVSRLRALFQGQIQLLQADLVRQDPGAQTGERYWHRDFAFPGERPLTVNVLTFIDDMPIGKGPTRVVPGSHRGDALPPADRLTEPLEGEVALTVAAGTAILINGAIWHTGGRNRGDGPRRAIIYYYGYSWLRRFDGTSGGRHDVPWEALVGASEARLQLLGVTPPDWEFRPDDKPRI